MAGSWQSTLENRAVDDFLRWLNYQELPTPENNEAKIAALDERIENEPRMFEKVKLVQQKTDLTAPTATPAQLEAAFVEHAQGFSQRNDITYATWRAMGVPAKVLKAAGFKTSPAGAKLATDAPERKRAYRPRRTWDDANRAEFIAYLEEHGLEAAAEKYGYAPAYVSQFVAEWRKDGRIPPKATKKRATPAA